VLITLNLLFKHIVKLLDIRIEIHFKIVKDPQFTPYFNNCINALNSTYIYAYLNVKL
jgi:hypothetical protein